jgi:ribosomal protein S18 acetylase RimI-like enzyme
MARILEGARDSSLSPYRAGVPVDEIQIRVPSPEEYGAAGAVTALAYHEFAVEGDDGWSWYLEHIADVGGRAGRTTVLVAVASSMVIGSATLELEGRVEPERAHPLDPDEAHLRMVGVHPDHRRRGVARRLVLECVDISRRRGKRRLTLETTPEMNAAHALYDSLGFTKGPTREVEEGFFLVTYELRLDG